MGSELTHSGRYEVCIEPDGIFSCWCRIYEVDESGKRLTDGYYSSLESAYCFTRIGARWWARRWIRQQSDLYKQKQAKKRERDSFIVDTTSKKAKERHDSWIKRTFIK